MEKRYIFIPVLLLLLLPFGGRAQGYEMKLPKLQTCPPLRVDKTAGTFIASWKGLDASVARSHLTYVGLEKKIHKNGMCAILETEIFGDRSMKGKHSRSLGLNSYVHDFMTCQGWYMRMGEVSSRGMVLRTEAGAPEAWAPVLQSPVFDASHNGGRFTLKFRASATNAVEPGKPVKVIVGHWADRIGTPAEERTIELKADGKVHAYSLECTNGMDNECLNIRPALMGSVITITGRLEVVSEVRTGDRIWHSIALSQMDVPAGKEVTLEGKNGEKLDCMTVHTSDAGRNVLDAGRYAKEGWKLFYTTFRMIASPDGMMTLATVYSDPVYFE